MLFLISLKYIERRKLLIYMIINIIGTLFHISSLLYLPLYFILNKKIHRTVILTLFFIGNLIFLLQIEWCKSVLIFVSTMISGRLGYLLKNYLSSSFYSSSYGISIGYLERFFSFVIFYYFTQRLYKSNNNIFIYLNAFYIYIFIFLYFSEVTIIFERVGALFVFSYWILYPLIYSSFKNKSRQIFLLILLFYGVLKLGVGNKDVFTIYDNILLPFKSYQERLEILNQHSKYIYNK
jgi:hypothetical protein